MANTWIEREITWTVHWFKGWTATQREEFLQELVEKSKGIPSHPLDIAMRGLSMSEGTNLFQCQLCLFSQWFQQWTDRDKNNLVEKIRKVDPAFVDRLTFALS